MFVIRSSRNRSKGSALVLSVAGLVVLVGGIVLGSLLLLNVGGATYAREKIGFIADQAALYATSIPTSPTRDAQVTDMAKQLMQNMGYSTQNTQITVVDTTSAGKPAVQVTVTASVATLLAGSFASVIPAQISMPYTATAVKNVWFNAYAQVVLLNPSQQTVICPMLSADFPADGLPHYYTNIFGRYTSP